MKSLKEMSLIELCKELSMVNMIEFYYVIAVEIAERLSVTEVDKLRVLRELLDHANINFDNKEKTIKL